MSSTDSKTLADTSVVFEDLSGVGSSTSENPYDALIEACENDPVYHCSVDVLSLLIESRHKFRPDMSCTVKHETVTSDQIS